MKFIRMAQHRVDRAGSGIVAFHHEPQLPGEPDFPRDAPESHAIALIKFMR